MPVPRFHLLSIDHEMFEGGFTVTVTTNDACHLYLRYSDVFPQIHRKTTQRRGLAMGWDARFCFVAYHHLEQDEAGDTSTHTFTWPGWVNCNTRYFYFWGTMVGHDMVSDTPIFWLHYLWEMPPEPDIICFYYSDYSYREKVTERYHVSVGFIPQADFSLAQVKHYLCRYGSPGVATTYIKRADAAHKPTGSVLSSGDFITSGLELQPNYTQITVPLSPAYVVETGLEYRICMKAELSPPTSYVAWPKRGGGTYSCNQTRTNMSPDWGVTWPWGESGNGYDFEIAGTPV